MQVPLKMKPHLLAEETLQHCLQSLEARDSGKANVNENVGCLFLGFMEAMSLSVRADKDPITTLQPKLLHQ